MNEFTNVRVSYRGRSNGGGRFPNQALFRNVSGRGYSPTERHVSQICNSPGYIVINCNQRLDLSYHGRAPPPNLSAMLASADIFDGEEWIVDSGANNHCYSRNISL